MNTEAQQTKEGTNMSQEQLKSKDKNSTDCHHDCDCVVLVRVDFNDGHLEIKPGKHTGAEIKKLSGVSATFELEVIRKGESIPISDTEEVKVRGCEKFIAFPCKGKAS